MRKYIIPYTDFGFKRLFVHTGKQRFVGSLNKNGLKNKSGKKND